MKSWRSLVVPLALLTAPVVSHAVPVEYQFDLTVTELGSGGSSNPPDPYYSGFHVGQVFQGSFLFDPDAAIPVSPGSSSYYGAFQYSVQIGDALIRSGVRSDGAARPVLNFLDSPAGAGADTFFMFDEIPLHDGFFGSEPDGYVEQFYFNLGSSSGAAFNGTAPGPVDFSAFDDTLFNFWWQPPDGPSSLGYSRLLMYGTVGNFQEVPEPGPLSLLVAAAGGLFGLRLIARRKRAAHV
jgi:hypothetical protein